MKILLLNGGFEETQINEPASILALSSYLKKNGKHEVILYDKFMFSNDVNHIENIIDENVDFIGISAFSFLSKSNIANLISNIRMQGNKAFIAVGGHDASLNWREYLEDCPAIDAIIVGEGELTLLELVNKLEAGEDFSKIPGIAYRDKSNGDFVITDHRELINIDELPFMDRTMLTKLLSTYGPRIIRYATMLSGRGCHGGCSFCSVRAYGKLQNNKYYKLRTIRNIIDEMKHVYNITGIKSFSFADDTFIVPGKNKLERLKEFHEGIKSLPFQVDELTIVTRVDDLDEPVIELLKNTGVNTMYIGIESFDDNDLRFYQKGITSNKIEKVIDDLIKHGYSFEVDAKRKLRPGFIIFNPYSSVESLLVNIKNFKKYKIPPKRLKRKLLIYRHTDLYERFSKSGMIDEKGNYQFLNPGIELVYNYFNNGLKRTEKIREEIRFLERLSHEFGIELDSSLKDIRIAIDNEWYELFEQLVIALKNNNLNQDVLEDWYINLVNKVDLNKIKELVSVEKQSILDEINSKYVLHKDFIRLFKMI